MNTTSKHVKLIIRVQQPMIEQTTLTSLNNVLKTFHRFFENEKYFHPISRGCKCTPYTHGKIAYASMCVFEFVWSHKTMNHTLPLLNYILAFKGLQVLTKRPENATLKVVVLGFILCLQERTMVHQPQKLIVHTNWDITRKKLWPCLQPIPGTCGKSQTHSVSYINEGHAYQHNWAKRLKR